MEMENLGDLSEDFWVKEPWAGIQVVYKSNS